MNACLSACLVEAKTKMLPIVRSAVARLLPCDATPILCSSIGRVGSSLTYRALVRERAKALFGVTRYSTETLLTATAWDVKDVAFRHGAIYKTHDFPYGLAATPLKAVFLYGRPSDCVLSVVRCHATKGPNWVQRHFAHMHARGGYDELLHTDVLRISEQIDAWSHARNADILGMRYESLWDNVDVLSEFVGFEVKLPARTERSFAEMDTDIVALARHSYRELDLREARLPDYFHSSAA